MGVKKSRIWMIREVGRKLKVQIVRSSQHLSKAHSLIGAAQMTQPCEMQSTLRSPHCQMLINMVAYILLVSIFYFQDEIPLSTRAFQAAPYFVCFIFGTFQSRTIKGQNLSGAGLSKTLERRLPRPGCTATGEGNFLKTRYLNLLGWEAREELVT